MEAVLITGVDSIAITPTAQGIMVMLCQKGPRRTGQEAYVLTFAMGDQVRLLIWETVCK